MSRISAFSNLQAKVFMDANQYVDYQTSHNVLHLGIWKGVAPIESESINWLGRPRIKVKLGRSSLRYWEMKTIFVNSSGSKECLRVLEDSSFLLPIFVITSPPFWVKNREITEQKRYGRIEAFDPEISESELQIASNMFDLWKESVS